MFNRYYHAFMGNWKKYSNPCLHSSSGTRVCAGQRPGMFIRNEVSICSVYALPILKVCSIGILAAPNQQTPNHGTQLVLFPHILHA
jgi:hypothetical protein